MIHWHWLVFEAIILGFVYLICRSYNHPTYQKDYGEFTWFIKGFWSIMCIFFLLIWGGYIWF
jgi:hypothetical protein